MTLQFGKQKEIFERYPHWIPDDVNSDSPLMLVSAHSKSKGNYMDCKVLLISE